MKFFFDSLDKKRMCEETSTICGARSPSILRPFKDNYDKKSTYWLLSRWKTWVVCVNYTKNRVVSVFWYKAVRYTHRNWRHATLQHLWPSNPRAQSFLEVLKRFLVSSSDWFVENNSICQRRRQTYKLLASFPGRGKTLETRLKT